MAEIYLKHLKDKSMYAQCYKQIVEKSPTGKTDSLCKGFGSGYYFFNLAQSYVLLGDAYMSIQEPERALEIYEQALRRNPKDAQLRAKMGQVRNEWIF